jgi:hypothetical protein
VDATFKETNKILTNLNHGFRSGYSCESQLLRTINDFLKEHDKSPQVDVAILDFSKAFDMDMLASLQSFVKSPVSIDTWKMFCNIGASWTAHSLSILLGILSGFLVALYHRNLGVLLERKKRK